MKYLVLSLGFLFVVSSCNKEDDSIDLNAPSATCTINAENFSSSSFEASINESDMMSINLSNGVYDLSFRIYNFSQKNEGEIIYFSTPGMGMVTFNQVTYSNFYNPPYEGELVFSGLDDNTLSGTFHFKGQDVASGSFLNVEVMNGSFENITY